MSFGDITLPLCRSVLGAYGRIAPTGRGTFRLARMARRLIRRDRWCGTFKVRSGLRLDLDLAVYPDVCMAFSLYELEVARLLRRLLSEGDHFVDGGANLGYFTLLAARCVGTSGRVDAFEPQPENRARLEANLQRNGLADRVRVHAAALSDSSGTARIHLFHGERFNHGCASLFAPAEASSEAAPVDTVRIDEVLKGATPRLVKLDVEGAEPLAIDGLAGLLAGSSPPSLIVEYNVRAAGSAGFAPREWVDRLLAIRPDYRLQVIGSGRRTVDPKVLFDESVGEANVLAVPGARDRD